MLTLFSRSNKLCKSRKFRTNSHQNLSLHSRKFEKNGIENWQKEKKASEGNRTPVDCLEGNHADHYTTDAHVRPHFIAVMSGNPRPVT
ncbi:hypothetical protein L596_022608 [Steinernema carpocapsae]|uniref:Uncharacterized protein n=1 Tax=Steinernema carpocapsae TaxID=34508 RepID=A0A4U5MN43_STECR|nr:hypothetical protein L596_022608 [Steinernema carpocapsae]